jgi:hypothetical protein
MRDRPVIGRIPIDFDVWRVDEVLFGIDHLGRFDLM